MSQLNFSGIDLKTKFGAETTLGVVFKALENDLKKVGEVVCQFKVNGMTLDEASEQRLAEVLLGEVETLDVTSQRPTEILQGVLGNWCLQIPKMLEKNDLLSSNFRYKGIEGQLKPLVALVDDCQLLVDSLISIDQVFPQLEVVQSTSWKTAQRQMALAIGEALAAFQKKDFTQLADILEYDMGHSLQVWLDILTGLQESTKNGSRHVVEDRNGSGEPE